MLAEAAVTIKRSLGVPGSNVEDVWMARGSKAAGGRGVDAFAVTKEKDTMIMELEGNRVATTC